MPFLIETKYLKQAARECMRKASSPGVDGVTWKQYRQNLQPNLIALSERLHKKTWEPSPVRVINVTLRTGKERTLVVPVVEDRIVHRAMKNALQPVLETRAFLDFVIGFRPGRTRLTALRKAMQYINQQQTFVADIDVANVSEQVTVSEASSWIANWISDASFLRLIVTALAGLPTPLSLGGGLSPLLIDLRLVPTDWKLSNLNVIRVADNYCVFCDTQEKAKEAFEFVQECLKESGLTPSPEKSSIRSMTNPEDLFLVAG